MRWGSLLSIKFSRRSNIQRRSWTAAAADGAISVPDWVHQNIIARRMKPCFLWRWVNRRVPGKGTTVNYPIDNEADGEFVLTSEQVDAYTNTFDRDSPAVSKKAFTLLKYTKDIP